MSRRPRREEMEFGSDSFLDVVANVVGILIILMVLAGIRAKHAPVRLDEVAQADPVPDMTTSTETAEAIDRDELSQELAELQSRSQALQADLDRLKQSAREQETQMSELQAQDIAQRNRAAQMTAQLKKREAELQSEQQLVEELLAEAQLARVKLKSQRAELAVAEKQPNRVERLQHRITPVSRVLTENDTELHFRCLDGKVVPIPYDELVERMKGQMNRMQEFIVRMKKYSGVAGPVRGWRMEFLFETQQHLGIVRVFLSHFELVPEADLDGERLDVALRPESVFRNELRKAEPGSTLTFWVYPDSFAMFRKLQALAHREGFTVAARPLPVGEKITGGPNGSRSAAQ